MADAGDDEHADVPAKTGKNRGIVELKIEPIYAGMQVSLESSIYESIGNLNDEIQKFKKTISDGIDFTGSDYSVTVPIVPASRVKHANVPNPSDDFRRLCVECGQEIIDMPLDVNLCAWHYNLKQTPGRAPMKISAPDMQAFAKDSVGAAYTISSAPNIQPVARQEYGTTYASPRPTLTDEGKTQLRMAYTAPAEEVQTRIGSFGAPAASGQPSENHRDRGFRFFEAKEWEGALAEFNAAIKETPQHARLYYMRGLTYYKRGDFERAESDFRRALNLDPNMAKANRDFGRVLMKKGRYDSAETYLRKALDIDPGIKDAQALIARNARERQSARERNAESGK